MAIAICGGKHVSGETHIQGSKNAVLPMMAASLLCSEQVIIENCPDISDVYAMAEALRTTGAQAVWEDHVLSLNASGLSSGTIGGDSAGRIRASVLLVGSLLHAFPQVAVECPGGCSIGSRPVDFHLEAFRRMGASVRVEDGKILCTVETRLRGEKIELPFPSVGATENILLAAVRAEGTTWIQNAAREPEVQELCRFLRKMGAEIKGEGTPHIIVQGKEKLHGCRWRLSADRIVFLTYALMAAGCGGECFLRIDSAELPREAAVLVKLGCELKTEKKGVWLRQAGSPQHIASVRTSPYPGFPTDGQSLLMAVLTKGRGVSIIEEGVFDNRFRMVKKLQKMGANIDCVCNCASVTGVTRLHGACVEADDLRSGAGLLIAGAMAEGETVVKGTHFIRRGYEDAVGRMRDLSLDARWTGAV